MAATFYILSAAALFLVFGVPCALFEYFYI